jgi:hypothetical protein
MQRQQVRAMVWPILEFDSSNAPDIHFTLANKGVGPAIIRNVIVRGGWAGGQELEGGARENTGTWGASGFGERHEWSCARRR